MQTLLSALRRHAHDTPHKPALLIGREQVWTQFSYADLQAETERWAQRYCTLDLRSGGIVLIVLTHRWELYPAFLGAMRAGLVPAFLPFPTPKQDPDLYWSTHDALFRRVMPAAIVSYGGNIARMAEMTAGFGCKMLDVDALPEPASGALAPLAEVEHPNWTALLQHSSGTTGLKKGVALTFGQIRDQIASYAEAIAATQADRIVSWLPLYHDMGLVTSFLMPVTVGCSVVSIDAFEWLARTGSLFELIERHRGTLCWLPNFAFNHLVRTAEPEQRYDLSSIRAFINCSEPCKPETFAGFRAAFEPHGLPPNALQTCYAMAEAVFGVTQSDLAASPRTFAVHAGSLAAERRVVPVAADNPGAEVFLSCGRPIAGVQVRIDASTLDSTGEIEIAGGFVFSEYHGNPADTAAAFADGWYKTGDIGFFHEGELFVCGRRKELIIVHGRNYYAHDIEEIVNTVPGVKPGRTIAFGAYDDTTASEEAVLLVESLTAEESGWTDLKRAVRKSVFDRLELTLRRVEVCPPGSLVKTTSGKLSRERNAERFAAGADAELPR